jgi:hypothetical protein
MPPGPLPHPQRQRRNKPTIPTVAVPSDAPHTELSWPPADPGWHPLAAEMYVSLPSSAQSARFEPSDVAAARVICEGLSRTLIASRFSPTAFRACVEALDGLGATLGARLRLRLDVQKPKSEPPSARALRRYRVVAGGGSDA